MNDDSRVPVQEDATPNDPHESPSAGVGLLANGTAGDWSVTIDEFVDRENEWYAELDGRRLYLYFQLTGLGVVSEVADFLRRRAPGAPQGDNNGSLTLGRFGDAAVSLLADDETPTRCFLVVGAGSKICMRVTLLGEDLAMLAEAFRQAADDLC